MNPNNHLITSLGIKYPFVQAPMLGVTTPAMVAAVSNEGGLGSLPVGGLPAARMLELVRETKRLTKQPFAVNLFVHANASADNRQEEAMQDFLGQLCAHNGIPYEKRSQADAPFYSYESLVQPLIEEGIKVISFTFGIPGDDSLQRFKENNITLIGTATNVPEAQLLADKGIDIITAQGIEAGGHRGTFLTPDPLPQIPLLQLLQRVKAQITTPLLAAGGMYNAGTIHAAMEAGAAGIQVGSAFIAAEESAAMPAYKKLVQSASTADLVLTKAITGRWARGIQNKLIQSVEEAGLAIPPYPVQANLTAGIRLAAQQQNNIDFNALWAGHSMQAAAAKPAAEIFWSLIEAAGWISPGA